MSRTVRNTTLDIISSVSGGSLSASYAVMYHNKLIKADPYNKDSQWAKFLDAMALDYRRKAILKALRPDQTLQLLWGKPWGHMLAEVFDEHVFDNRRIKQLPSKPILLINTTESALGQFIFTAHSEKAILLKNSLQEQLSLAHLPNIPDDPEALTLEWANVDPQSIPVSYAVYASAAVPGLLPPFILKAYDSETGNPQYLKMVDGGIWDNQGFTVIYPFVDKYLSLSQRKPKSIVMLSIDATNTQHLRVKLRQKYKFAKKELLEYAENVDSNGIKGIMQVLDIIYSRRENLQSDYYAATYRTPLCNRFPEIIFYHDGISLNQLEYVSKKNWDDVLSTRKELSLIKIAYNINDVVDLLNRISKIPTDFQLTKEHRELLMLSAAVLVKDNGEGIVQLVSEEANNLFSGFTCNNRRR